MKDLDRLVTEVFGSYSRNAHFAGDGTLAYYRHEKDTLYSFIKPPTFVARCKKWIIGHEGHSAISGVSATRQWFEVCKNGTPIKTVVENREHSAAAEVVLWMMDGEE